MAKSLIPQGPMVFHYNPLTMDRPRVWVKVDDTQEEPSLFIDNNVLVQSAINKKRKPKADEKWLITDEFYGKMVRQGLFVPLDDLNQAERITEELGWPPYYVDLGF